MQSSLHVAPRSLRCTLRTTFASLRALCAGSTTTSCTEIIHWRKAYRKYKPLTAARKCTACQQKTVRDAYHVLCQPCATERGVCAKCLVSGEVVASTVKTAAEMNRERIEMENMVAGMSERERRSFLRRIAREGEGDSESETEHSEDGRSDDEDDHCGHSDDDDDDANASDSSVVEAVGRVQLASQQSDDAETVSDKDDESSSS